MPSALDIDGDIALIVRGVSRLARRLRTGAPAGTVGGGALALLATLHRAGPMPAVALAHEEGLAPQSLTRLLHHLEAQAMIERSRDPADRRNRVIAITPHGRQSLRHAMRARRQWLAAAMADRLSEDERGRLVDAAELMLRLAM